LVQEDVKSSDVFYIHHFSVFRAYVISCILLFVSWKIFSIAGSLPTYLDTVFITSFLISIPIIYHIHLSRFDIYGAIRVALVIVIFLVPVILLQYGLKDVLPLDLEKALLQVYAIFSEIFLHPYLSFILSGITLFFSLLILAGVSQSSWVIRLKIENNLIVKEQMIPYLRFFEIDLRFVDDVKVTQSILQRRLDYGLVTVVTNNEMVDLGVTGKPEKLKKQILERISSLKGRELKKAVVPYDAFIMQTLTEESPCHLCEEQLLEVGKPSKLMVCPNCRTTFHGSCLRKWLTTEESCPVCQVPLQAIMLPK
jgi:hypothetical protein